MFILKVNYPFKKSLGWDIWLSSVWEVGTYAVSPVFPRLTSSFCVFYRCFVGWRVQGGWLWRWRRASGWGWCHRLRPRWWRVKWEHLWRTAEEEEVQWRSACRSVGWREHENIMKQQQRRPHTHTSQTRHNERLEVYCKNVKRFPKMMIWMISCNFCPCQRFNVFWEKYSGNNWYLLLLDEQKFRPHGQHILSIKSFSVLLWCHWFHPVKST